jgi:hypothetical protein
MGTEHLLQSLCQVLQQVKAIGDLDGRRPAVPNASLIRFEPVASNHCNPWMGPEPRGHGFRRTIG